MLSTLIFLPVLFALLCLVMPSKVLKPVALIFSLIEFVLSLCLLKNFNTQTAGLQMTEVYEWIPSLGIQYFVGIDGISLWLVILTTFLTPICILSAWTSISKNPKGFLTAFFILETTMLGTFLAFDSLLFYIFFEVALIPMYFIVGLWGGARRIYASIKFFLYTMLGSVLMLACIFYLMHFVEVFSGSMSSNLLDFYSLAIPYEKGEFFSPQTLLFFGFALAFAIKVPLFPLHSWLPDAHVEAPTPGSIVLAGVMLKMGGYGFLRFCLPLFPMAWQEWSLFFVFLSVVGILYGACVALVQEDIKKLVAYSSVSHMGYVILGFFALNIYGVTGGLYQMLNHGISTAGLFLLVGMIYERTHSREIKQYGGLASAAPIFTICFFILTFSSIAVPLTNGFVGEFLILLGSFKSYPFITGFAVLGVILSAAYMLWMCKRVFFGEQGDLVKNTKNLDMNKREFATTLPLLILVFVMGIYPKLFLSYSETSLEHLLKNKNNYELFIEKPIVKKKQGQ